MMRSQKQDVFLASKLQKKDVFLCYSINTNGLALKVSSIPIENKTFKFFVFTASETLFIESCFVKYDASICGNVYGARVVLS